MNPSPRPTALMITLMYAALAGSWILFSDRALELWLDSPATIALVSTFKGYFFVACTSLALYALLSRRQPDAPAPVLPVRGGLAPFLIFSLPVLVVTLAAAAYSLRQKEVTEGKRLRSIIEVRVQQISAWLGESETDVKIMFSDPFLIEAYRSWRQDGDQSRREYLLRRLEAVSDFGIFRGLKLLDENGQTLWKSPRVIETPSEPPVWHTSTDSSLAIMGPYQDESGQIRLDFLVPLDPKSPKGPSVWLQGYPKEQLPGEFFRWPGPTSTGELLLFFRQGQDVVYLNHPRGLPATRQRVPASPNLLASRVAQRETGSLLKAVDYSGVPVIGLGAPIPGTQWFLLGKIARSEIFQLAASDLSWITLAGLLGLVVVGNGLSATAHRQQLAIAAATRQAQDERLRATRLLSSIADSSSDGIYAKDLQGRYLVFNLAAQKAAGKTEQEVLGQDDFAVFPEVAALLRDNDRLVLETKSALTFREEVVSPRGPVTLESTKGPLYDDAGQTIGLYGLSRDITENLKGELERQAQLEELLRWQQVTSARENRLLELKQQVNQLLLSSGQPPAYPDPASHPEIERATGGEEQNRLTLLSLLEDARLAQQSLRDSEARYRTMAENVIDTIWVFDLNRQRYTYVSPSHQRLTGFTLEEVLQQSIADSVTEESYERVSELLVGALAAAAASQDSQQINTSELELVAKDGRHIPVEVVATLLCDELGRPTHLQGTTRDIRQRKAMQSQLREREESFRLMAEQVPAILYRVSLDESLKTLYVSPRVAELGYTPEEWMSQPWNAQIHPEDRETVGQQFEAFRQGGGLLSLEYRLRAKDGSWRHYKNLGQILRDPHNQPLYLQGVMLDITSMKESEETLELMASRAEAMLGLPAAAEQMSEADFLQHGLDLLEHLTESQISFSHFINADSKSIELVSWSNRTLEQYCRAADDTHYSVCEAAIWADSLRERTPVIINDYASYLGLRGLPEGHSPLKRLITLPVLEDGRVVMVTGVGNKLEDYTARDVETLQLVANDQWRLVQRRRSQIELHKLSQAVEQSPDSIVITNLAAEVEYVNEAFLQNSGYARSEVLGQNPRILQSGHTPPETFAQMWTHLNQGQAWKGQLHNRRKDGSEYVEFAHICPLRQSDGSVTHYLAIKQDITEKMRLSSELERHRDHLEELVEKRTAELQEARARAEAASQAKSIFLANMSHEIRTPMNAILGLTHLLRRGNVAPLQAERLGKIDYAARHLLSIINDILDVSKIEANKLVLEDANFALSAVLEAARSLVQDAAAGKGLKLVVEVDQVPTWLRGDPTRIRQALLNYVSNAIKFTERGQITLRTRLLESVGDRMLVRFEVEDTGVGIPPDKLDRLFQAFEQADASTTRKYGGTGLGLAITQHLARFMGGEAGAQSRVGQGSLFWFTARLGHGEGEMPPPVESVGQDEEKLYAQYSGARLLLVEDNAINREVATELLKVVGLTVDTAENGQEAVEKASAAVYDLVLMDIQMPVLDGLEAHPCHSCPTRLGHPPHSGHERQRLRRRSHSLSGGGHE
jgi:PAS domain S-box-containing protein